MSTAPDHRKYFRKNSEGTFPLEHYEIVDMIRAGSAPEFDVSTKLLTASSTERNYNFLMSLDIQNVSELTAEWPYLRFEKPFETFQFQNGLGMFHYADDRDGLVKFSSKLFLQSMLLPGEREEVARFPISATRQADGTILIYWGHIGTSVHKPLDTDCELNCYVGSKNGYNSLKKVVIRRRDLEADILRLIDP
jgi:hypothetical protein